MSGPSGVGKTRLLARLVGLLAARGVRVGVLKHTGHAHGLDVPGKDTDVLRRAGAVAAAIEGPAEMAYFGPPAGGARALARLLPPVDLILAEGWKREPLPRIEVHRARVARPFLCATDRRVFAVVTDVAPPRPVPAFGADDIAPLADLLCARFGIASPRRGRARLRVRPSVSSLPAKGSERTFALGGRSHMAKTTNRRGAKRSSARGARRSSTGSRSAAGRKGGTATLRSRGAEFYSEIGKKGGRSRAAASRRARAAGARSTGARAGGGRAASKGTRRAT
ncbi:molybdopterin-guanine dinucleotide biosynthesis protein B, partial [Anaeromyxobacter oryzisoli]|uniref:molybdopterin-guanine dinucleotide biosynthesis protein B n=1 Tax=Anaeromyxobacter oryzisoli TaxID=2925408 RepID=UPI001F5A254A